MNRKFYIIFILFSALYLFWHIFTLSYNPLPWFDDTYFASITMSLIEHGDFIPRISYHAQDGWEALIYGPVYFFLTGIPLKIFGLGLLQFRIVNLLFGFMSIWVCLKIIRLNGFSGSAIVFISVLALDPFFTLSMHEGRMDLTALFFALLSLYYILKNGKKDICYSAVSASLALLTTPRSAIVIIGVVMILVVNSYKDGRYKPLIIWSAILLGIYATWIFYAFGGPLECLNYYKDVEEREHYLGGRFYIPRQEHVLIVAALFSIFINFIRKRTDFPDLLSSISIAVILLFYAIVLDWGPYSALIIPFYYMLIFNKDEFRWSFSNPRLYLLIVLLMHNTCYFSLKSLQIIASMEQRDPAIADKFIADHISPGSKVVGDALYFYSVKRSGSDYQLFHEYGTLPERERKHRELYNYDYLIITEQSLSREGEAVALYLGNAKFQKVAELKNAPSMLNQKIASLGLISNTEDSGYNATIYIRIKGPETLPMAILRSAR
jgi:4-amino-4-deoxy-L-arabinose transferase-like glycosyltransferase